MVSLLPRLSSRFAKFDKILIQMGRSFRQVSSMALVLLIFLYIVAILSMHILGGKFGPPEERPRHHFDHFSMAFATTFQVITTENWAAVMYDAYAATDDSWLVLLFFIFIVFFGNLVVLNMFLAILLGELSLDYEEGQQDRQRDMVVGALKRVRAARTIERIFIAKLPPSSVYRAATFSKRNARGRHAHSTRQHSRYRRPRASPKPACSPALEND